MRAAIRLLEDNEYKEVCVINHNYPCDDIV